jgi:diguanylate cyclase (GGDEF)-like protein
VTELFRRVRPWQLCLAAAPLIIAAYYDVGSLGPGWSMFKQVLYCSANATAAVSSVAVAVRNPKVRVALLLIGACALSNVIGDAIFYYQAFSGHQEFPGPADFFYLLTCPLMALGLLHVIRQRTPGWDGASAIDAAIVGVSSGYLIYAYIAEPTVRAVSGQHAGTPAILVSLAYPAGDLILLLFGVRLMLGAGPRTPSLALLGGYSIGLFATNMIYMILSLNGTFHAGSFVDGMWMGVEFLLAAAVLHPSVPQMFARSDTSTPDANSGRVLVLGLAATIAPTSMLVEYVRGHGHLNIPVIALTCDVLFLLVLVRMAGLVSAQRQAAITDGRTGLRSRRFFDQALDQEIARTKRSHTEMSMLILDIDFFKKVNDTYGHNGGDRVLVEVSHRLRSLVGSGELVARFGGEEFVVLLPGGGIEAAHHLAERIRRGISASPIPVGGNRLHNVTVSMGVAGLPYTCNSAEELMLAADGALYASKRSGRDRVTVAGGPSDESVKAATCAPALTMDAELSR